MKSVLAALSFSVAASKEYCPSEDDLTVAYTVNGGHGPFLQDRGWIIMGGGGVASKAAFNLLGGFVEFDVDLAGVKSGVNANVYAISPKDFPHGHFDKKSDYCDGAETGSNFCLEVDWLEANGHCGAAMTIHAIEGPGNGCTAWGCRASYDLKSTKYHYRIDYHTDGKVTVSRNGHVIPDLYPTPGGDIWATIREINQRHGSVIYSSEWVGWVPREGCGTNGDLQSSAFTVSNLMIKGSVVKGPEPRKCANGGRRRRSAPAPRPSTSRRRRSREQCATDTEDCRSAGCCKDSSKTCYEKDAGWASCRDTGSCHPGQVNPYDPPNARTPWTCKKPGSSPSPPPDSRRRRSRAHCASDTVDCRSSGCCQDPSKTCYEKDGGWASCRDTGSCHPGQVNPYDPPNARTPWTCKPITRSLSNMTLLV